MWCAPLGSNIRLDGDKTLEENQGRPRIHRKQHMRSPQKCWLALLVAACLHGGYVHAQPLDPLDPFEAYNSALEDTDAAADKNKSADELLLEATILMQDERLLDARTKLLRALEKDPKSFQVHSLLSGYYLAHVGHYRLALKYIKKAQQLFEEQNGKPPFSDFRLRMQHGHLLYILSQVRLNLDDYQGSLDVLDEYAKLGYSAEWYYGSRAWVLMKLDRLDDAIAAARLAVLSGQERGRSLNVLGILLSMKKDREGSLRIFREAIAEELALGTLGQPATPLNNSGEVYEEIFQEDKAEGAWLRATGMPDGCEHVLPTLNLTLLYIEQLNLAGASRALDNFESCIAQYPLRNGEEHRALVELARGRIAFHSGDSAQAISKFESALQHRQWFGKIGTNQDDLYSAGLISLSAALQAQAYSLSIQLTNGVFEEIKKWKLIVEHRVRAWWLMRRARQVLIEDLKNIEDLFIRNTDSLIEYPTFGTVLAGIPSSTFEERLVREIEQDSRKDAQLYYQAYKGENLLQHGDPQNGIQLLNQVINGARPKYDSLLRLHAILVSLQKLTPGTDEYASLAQQAYAISRPSLRNEGYALPVNYAEGDKEILSALKKTGFILDNTRSLQYAVGYYRSQQGIELEFRSTAGGQVSVKVRGADLFEAINKFNEEVFTQDLK